MWCFSLPTYRWYTLGSQIDGWCFGISIGCNLSGLLLMNIQEMTAEAEIVSVSFTKSIIKSSAALSYVEAQARMDDRCVLQSTEFQTASLLFCLCFCLCINLFLPAHLVLVPSQHCICGFV
jgi:exosome complex exonuclease DIS3/RRP44